MSATVPAGSHRRWNSTPPEVRGLKPTSTGSVWLRHTEWDHPGVAERLTMVDVDFSPRPAADLECPLGANPRPDRWTASPDSCQLAPDSPVAVHSADQLAPGRPYAR